MNRSTWGKGEVKLWKKMAISEVWLIRWKRPRAKNATLMLVSAIAVSPRLSLEIILEDLYQTFCWLSANLNLLRSSSSVDCLRSILAVGTFFGELWTIKGNSKFAILCVTEILRDQR